MEKLQSTGCYQVDEVTLKAIQETFSAGYLDDNATKKCIHDIYQQDNYVADTHTAVACQVAQDYQKSTQGLAQLQSLPILHNNLCAKEDMIKAVNTFLNI